MSEIAILGVGTSVATSTPTKSAAPASDKSFDRVFSDKQQVRSETSDNSSHVSNSSAASRQRDTDTVQQNSNSSDQVSSDQESVAEETSSLTQEDGQSSEPVTCCETTEIKSENPQEPGVADVQDALMSLMKAIAGSDEIPVSEEEMTALVTDLVQSLEQTELNGEEVLAGIDLSQLKDQLDLIAASDNPEEQMTDLITQMSDQLQSNLDLVQQLVTADNGKGAPVKGGGLAQARNLLQQVVANNTANTSDDQSLVENSVDGLEGATGLSADGEKTEAIDPRFAGLLNVRQEQKGSPTPVVKSSAQGQQAQLPVDAVTEEVTEGVDGLEQELTATVSKLSHASHGDASLQSQLSKAGIDGQVAHGQALPTQNGTNMVDSSKVMPSTATIQLPSGLQVAESQIFDQVVTHLSGSVNGDSGRMVLRLNPAELGSLKLDVVVDGDEVRANIHAQSQQVQEVIERHLPQLRNALAEQGLKIEQFRVDIDKQQSEGGFESFAEQQQQQQQNNSWSYEEVEEEPLIPLSQLMQTGNTGISLHV